jgi:hypothetical protein
MIRARTFGRIVALAAVGVSVALLAQTPASSSGRPLNEAQKKVFVDHATMHYLSPEDVVVQLFKDHDVVSSHCSLL